MFTHHGRPLCSTFLGCLVKEGTPGDAWMRIWGCVPAWIHILESLIHLLGLSQGDNSSWGETCPSAAPSSVPPAQGWDGGWIHPHGVLICHYLWVLVWKYEVCVCLVGEGGPGGWWAWAEPEPKKSDVLVCCGAFLPGSIADSSGWRRQRFCFTPPILTWILLYSSMKWFGVC